MTDTHKTKSAGGATKKRSGPDGWTHSKAYGEMI